MKRRSFMTALGAVVAALAIDPLAAAHLSHLAMVLDAVLGTGSIRCGSLPIYS